MLKQTRLQLIYVLTIALCTFKVMTTIILVRRRELEYFTPTLCHLIEKRHYTFSGLVGSLFKYLMQ